MWRNIMNCMVRFRTPAWYFGCFYSHLLWIIPLPIMKEGQALDKESLLAIYVLDHLKYHLLASRSVGKFLVWVLKVLLPWQLMHWYFTLKSQQAQTLSGACCQLSTNIIQLLFSLDMMFTYFILASAEPVISKFSTNLYIVLLCDTVDMEYVVQNLWQHFFLWVIFGKVLKINCLYSTECISFACWNHLHWMIYERWWECLVHTPALFARIPT